eukprot:s4221_g2.t1
MFSRLCFNAVALAALTAAAPGLRGLTNTSNATVTQRSANGCDCSWIANDDCINQDPCAVSCRQSHGSPCSVGAAGGAQSAAACQATCDSSFGSCNRWLDSKPYEASARVVLLDWPRDATEYLRRVGRTARADKGGSVLTLLCGPKEARMGKQITAAAIRCQKLTTKGADFEER